MPTKMFCLPVQVAFLILSVVHLSTVQGKYSGSVPPNKLDRLTAGFRPPSVPLIVVDPYFSIWSSANHLYDDVTRFWNGNSINISGMVAVDGSLYRFMSNEPSLPLDSMTQVNLTVFPTQTVYTFEGGGVQLVLTFSTPAVWDYIYKFPVTILTYDVRSLDGKNHTVRLYYDNTAEGTVSDNSHEVAWERVKVADNYQTMRIGNAVQDYLAQTNDRINWGYWLVHVADDPTLQTSMASAELCRKNFITNLPLPPDDMFMPQPCDTDTPVLAVAWDLGVVTPSQTVSKSLVVTYDPIYSMMYFGTPMIPMWKKEFGTVENMLSLMNKTKLKTVMDKEDDRITSDLYAEGGSNYTTISSLAWRQAIGATIAVYNSHIDEMWMFMKEISSDGDVSTVDVIYPASPLFLWNYNASFSPIKLLLLPILNYANNKTAEYGLYMPYNLSWAPHHLGRWPICDIAASHQEQMPMEESGNMLMMLAYLVMRDSDTSFLEPYWDLLDTWGKYLKDSLPDPKKQLCTDDFEGKSPHNSNLAVKGMVGMRAYAYLLEKRNMHQRAEDYILKDKNFTIIWWIYSMDGVNIKHSRLQYDLHDTWSLKYNFLFRQVMNFTDIFHDEDITRDMKFYMTQINEFGIPLDNRQEYTKADWEMWVAAMGTQEQFETITNLVYNFAHYTPNRVPMSDWYYTFTAEQRGFQARPVVGGYFSRMLLTAAQKQMRT